MPHSEIIKVVLVHCNIVSNDHQQDSRVFYIFIPNKSFDWLLDISTKILIFSITFNWAFSYIEVWFTDQNSKSLEIKNKTKINLFIDWSITDKKWCTSHFNIETEDL